MPSPRHAAGTPPTTAPDEAALAQRLRAGDESAIAELFTAYHTTLCRFAASYTRDPAQAEEIVQDVFLALWEKHASIQYPNGLRAYLFSAARNRALNIARHARYERALVLRPHDTDVPGMGRPPKMTDAQARAAEIDAAVTAAMRGMPARLREVLVLSWREGLSHPEIARVLGLTTKTVHNHVARAMQHLRRVLGSKFP
jgi:RNA polymerase sigma-70 factor (ECF subfamily)